MNFKDYKKLLEKYSLPEWEEINNYFPLKEIELSKVFPLKSIVKAIDKRLSEIRGEIEIVLFPTEDLFVLYELNAFKDYDTKILTKLYKEINYLLRKIDLFLLSQDEKLGEELINEAFEFMKKNFDKIKEIYERKMKVWKEEFKLEKPRSYYL